MMPVFGERVHHRFARLQQPAPRDAGVTVGHVVGTVRGQHLRTRRPPARRQLEPAPRWLAVVHRVQVVVQEQQAGQRTGLHHGGALGDRLGRAVLDEGAHHQHRHRRVGHRQRVGHGVDAGDGERAEHGHQGQRVHEPGATDAGLGAAQPPQLRTPEACQRERRAHRHPSGQRRVRPQQRARHRSGASPGLLRQIPALRIVVGIGQPLVAVVGDVQRPEPPVRYEQPECREAERLVRPAAGGGVTVQEFVLQRGVQRHQQHGRHDPQRPEGIVTEHQPEPGERAARDQRPGGPFAQRPERARNGGTGPGAARGRDGAGRRRRYGQRGQRHRVVPGRGNLSCRKDSSS